MSPRENRVIQNETLFREVNTRIAELEARMSTGSELLPLVCECANTGCTTLIEVDPGTFRTVRESPLRFLVAPGHARGDETVIGRGGGYLIVEKQVRI